MTDDTPSPPPVVPFEGEIIHDEEKGLLIFTGEEWEPYG